MATGAGGAAGCWSASSSSGRAAGRTVRDPTGSERRCLALCISPRNPLMQKPAVVSPRVTAPYSHLCNGKVGFQKDA